MNRDFRIFYILGITHLTQFEIGNIAEDAHLHHGNAAKPLVKLTHTLYRSRFQSPFQENLSEPLITS